MKLTTTTRVQVLVEVSAGHYSTEDTTIGQVVDQAAREASQKIINVLNFRNQELSARIIGEPTVLMVTHMTEAGRK